MSTSIKDVSIDEWQENNCIGYKMPFAKSVVILKDDHPFLKLSDKHRSYKSKSSSEIEFFYTIEVRPYDHISARFSLYSVENGVISHIYSLRSYLSGFCVKAEFTENYFIERDKIKKASEKFGL